MLVVLGLAACGPARSTSPRGVACDAAFEGEPTPEGLGSVATLIGRPVVRVTLEGVPEVVRAPVTTKLAVRAGDLLELEEVRADLRSLAALEIARDVAIEADEVEGGLAITYRLAPMGRLERVTIDGLDHPAVAELAGLAGGLDNAGRIERTRLRVLERLRRDGYLDATLVARVRPGQLCIAGSLGRTYRIERIAIEGATAIAATEIERRLVRRIGVNLINGVHQPALLEASLQGIRDEYLARGFLDARLEARRPAIDPARGTVALRIVVTEGERYSIARVAFTGEPLGPALRRPLERLAGSTYSVRAVQGALDQVRRGAVDEGLLVEARVHSSTKARGQVVLVVETRAVGRPDAP